MSDVLTARPHIRLIRRILPKLSNFWFDHNSSYFYHLTHPAKARAAAPAPPNGSIREHERHLGIGGLTDVQRDSDGGPVHQYGRSAGLDAQGRRVHGRPVPAQRLVRLLHGLQWLLWLR